MPSFRHEPSGKRFFFAHIPRTAGRYVEANILGNDNQIAWYDDWEGLGNKYLGELGTIWRVLGGWDGRFKSLVFDDSYFRKYQTAPRRIIIIVDQAGTTDTPGWICQLWRRHGTECATLHLVATGRAAVGCCRASVHGAIRVPKPWS